MTEDKDAFKARIALLEQVIRDNWQGSYWRAVSHSQADEVRQALGEAAPVEFDDSYRPKGTAIEGRAQ